MTLQRLDRMAFDLDGLEEHALVLALLARRIQEFTGYIAANRAHIPNYGDRYRHGERIATGFVESTINQVVSKRFEKKQQMRWTQRGAHLLLQIRTQVLNGDWRDTFCRWYPAMPPEEAPALLAA